MLECSAAAAYIVNPDDNITDDVFFNAENWPDAVGLRRRTSDGWAPVTWRDFAEQVRGLAAGFIAAGIQPGDRVALMSRTRFEWTLLDYAILTAGGVTVPIYPTSSREQVEWILGDSGAVAVIVETDEHAEMVAAVAGRAARRSPTCGRSTAAASAGLPTSRSAATTSRRSRSRSGAGPAAPATSPRSSTPPARPAARRAACSATATSSPTPVTACRTTASARVFNENRSTLLFLPLAHSYAQLIQYGAIYSRTVLGLADMADAVGRAAGLPAHGGAVGAAGVGEGVQQRQAQGRRRGHGKIFATRGGDGDRVQPGAGRRAVPASALRLRHAAVRPARLRQAARRARRPGAVRVERGRPARRPARALLPRLRHHRARGLRPDRDQPGDQLQHARRAEGRHGRPAHPRLHDPDRARRRGAHQGAHGLPGLLEQRGRDQGDDRRGRLAPHR